MESWVKDIIKYRVNMEADHPNLKSTDEVK